MSNFLIKPLFVNEQPVSYRRFVSVNRNPFQRWSVQRSRSNRAGNGNRIRREEPGFIGKTLLPSCKFAQVHAGLLSRLVLTQIGRASSRERLERSEGVGW